MNKESLTVCIPTYNRPEHITIQVRDVLSQLDENTRLIVLDNHSDIPVSSLFSIEELKRFTIVRHNSNIGGDANNARCLEMVPEGWVWLLGDDDRIRPDVISTIQKLITDYKDCCFINTGNKKNFLASNYDVYLNYFRIRGAFGNAFFQSACLFNMSQLKTSIYWIYNFLSTQIGQFCIVMKHMELNPDAKCFFTTERLITSKDYGTWSRLDFIVNSSLFVTKNLYNKKKLTPNVLAALSSYYVDNIVYLNIGFFKTIKWVSFVIRVFGLYHLLRYSYISLVNLFINLILPRSLCEIIYRSLAVRYNKKVRK